MSIRFLLFCCMIPCLLQSAENPVNVLQPVTRTNQKHVSKCPFMHGTRWVKDTYKKVKQLALKRVTEQQLRKIFAWSIVAGLSAGALLWLYLEDARKVAALEKIVDEINSTGTIPDIIQTAVRTKAKKLQIRQLPTGEQVISYSM